LKLLITGAGGLFGSKLAQKAEEMNHEVYSIYSQHAPLHGISIQLDITDKTNVADKFKEIKPEVVVHAAALTDVDKCEKEKKLAWKINVEGTENITRASKKSQAFVVYVSTDYVFNGEKGWYTETDLPAPINNYGLTKLKAEEQVKNSTKKYCIARASVIYGSTPAAGKDNFALWVMTKLKNREAVRIVTDQWNSPTLNTNLADMTLEIIERKLTGTYHMSGATRINRYDFSKTLANAFNLDTDLITPAASADFNWPAKRPREDRRSTRLNSSHTFR
jgi:dTDP-4-dehydrorhamnose reductase